MQLRHARGCHMVFWKPVQPLQRVPRLACSVASLSRYPGHQLLRHCSLHRNTSTGYLLGEEPPSARRMAHDMQHCIPAPEIAAKPITQSFLLRRNAERPFLHSAGNVHKSFPRPVLALRLEQLGGRRRFASAPPRLSQAGCQRIPSHMRFDSCWFWARVSVRCVLDFFCVRDLGNDLSG